VEILSEERRSHCGGVNGEAFPKLNPAKQNEVHSLGDGFASELRSCS